MYNFLKRHILIISGLVITTLSYYQGLGEGFVLDDLHNIVKNPHLKIESLEFDSLRRAALSGESGILKRPISYLTFALEKHYFQDNAIPYKITNIIIHLLNGILLYILCLKLLNFQFINRNLSSLRLTAALITSIWLIHPLNVTSVLYIVQRMNSLSTLFILLGINSYIYFRTKPSLNMRNTYLAFVSASIFTLLAVLTKENGILLLPILLLVELYFLDFKISSNTPSKTFKYLWFALILFPIFIVLSYLTTHPEKLLATYDIREFTIGERLITQPRVLFYYIYLFLNPFSQEFSVFHDSFEVSKNLLSPWTTLLALSSILFIVFFALINYKKRPIFSFVIFWFLICHSLESTIFSLEMVFEHRNYLASMGLSFGIILWLTTLLKKLDFDHPRFMSLIMYFSVVIIANINLLTWQNSFLFALTNQARQPNSERANFEVGRIYLTQYENNKNELNFDSSEYYFLEAIGSKNSGVSGYFGLIFLYESANKEIPPKIIDSIANHFKNASLKPSDSNFLYSLSWCFITKKCKQNLEATILIYKSALGYKKTTDMVSSRVYSSFGDLLSLHMGEYSEALESYAIAANLEPNNPYFQLRIAETYLLLGRLDEALEVFLIAKSTDFYKLHTKQIEKGISRIALYKK